MSPPIIDSRQAEQEGLLEAARQMMLSARTAPKSGGIDDVLTLILHGKEKDSIAEQMEEIAEKRKSEGFGRDARNVRNSEAIVLIGIKRTKGFGLNCGACGFETCEEFNAKEQLGEDFWGPTCLFKSLDMGIALGSAVKTANILNVDNRIMYRVGSAAMRLNVMPEAAVIIGIPVSARGKSIYFDRAK